MFLKRNKLLQWILCFLAAGCLTAGMLLAQPMNSATVPEETAVTQPGAKPSDGAVLPETVEAAVLPSEDFQPKVTQAEASDSAFRMGEQSSLRRFGSLGALIAGAFLGFCFVFLAQQGRPGLGPEAELFVLLGAYFLLFRSPNWLLLLDIGLRFFAWSLTLIALRGLWSWLRSGLSLCWSNAHRAAALFSAGKQSRYLIFQLILSLLALFACFGLGAYGIITFSAFSLFLAGAFLIAAILSICCWVKLVRGVEHLTEQIGHLYQGNEITIRPGPFEDTEKQLIELHKQRQEAVRTAIASERFKVELISNVSHDLRTPLTAILGYGELLEKEKLSPQGKEQLQRLNGKAGYMRELVDALFELTKISSGAVAAKQEEIDLIRLLEQTIGLFDDRLQERGLQIRRHYPSAGLPCITDGARLHQVFANLIGNAVKYTLAGTRIHLEVREEAKECTVRITNIASYEMDFQPEEILQRFVRGDKARSTQGSGLGLAIAQTYTESVGGRFHVSIDGEQFSAVVTLPKIERNL